MSTLRANRAEMAELLKLSLPTFSGLISVGCPYIEKGAKGKEWVFDVAEVFLWWAEHKVKAETGQATLTEDELKLRKLEAETVMAELELAKARKEVAPISLMTRMMSHVFSQVRAGIRNLPERCVSRMIGETDPQRFKSIMLEEIDIVLTALATADLSDGYVEGGSDEGEEE